jgi:hypothetical protein
MRIVAILLLLVFFCGASSFAQKKPRNIHRDTINTRGDTTSVLVPFKPKSEQGVQKVYHPDSTHSPHKAILKSLYFAGLGQIYNHQYWKLPIVYGGLAGLGYSFYVAQSNYKSLLRDATAISRGQRENLENPDFKDQSVQTITSFVDFYHRNRDLTVIGTVAFWGIQAIDAYIAAKFQHSYTMDNNLGFKVSPSIINNPAYTFGYVPGVKLTFKMK